MLDVRRSPELQATILSLRRAQRDVRLDINKAARGRLTPLWRQELNARARSNLEREVITSGARVAATDRGVTLHAATRRRPLSGGLVPSLEWAGAEFGANTRRIQVSQRSRGGTRYTRPLTINRQFDSRSSEGQVAFAAASDTGTQLVALWVDTVIDQFRQIPTVEVVA
ncbi:MULTISPECIES: hypothetical protein [Microbacterium]|uniref:Uncharacterized protein n=1 Tax=Microbacterium maritypicum MF109 TaxID=1333857 RepID=T5KKV8_MICMQ|nr:MULTISPECIES: hypothetical protein [Microbacterium]EQM75921.1 hypothetical protein L687_18595 [Microbacterium maritypicum MF109]